MSEIIIGDQNDLQKDQNPFPKEEGEFKCFLTNVGMILCFASKKNAEGLEVWDTPLVLESITQRNPATNEMVRSQGFRPLIPLTKDTTFIPNSVKDLLAVEIKDPKLENAYRGTVRDIRMQMAGLITPTVGETSKIIVG
jgi:hypothetical protein